MPFNVPNEGESRMLEYIVNKVAPENLVLRLFGNNFTPGENDNTASLTEISGGGYASKTLVGASWSVANGNNAIATYATQSFVFTGPTTPNAVYGYYITTSNRLMLVERFADGPYPINNNNDSISVTPKLELEG